VINKFYFGRKKIMSYYYPYYSRFYISYSVMLQPLKLRAPLGDQELRLKLLLPESQQRLPYEGQE
jgi:hypothetical protein